MQETLNTPILFLIFNKEETTKSVFSAIRKAKPTRFYIASDGARKSKENEKDKVDSIRDYVVNNVDWDCKIKTLFRDENQGCAKAVTTAINWFFEHEENGIILEDDILPNPSFFNFCDVLLNKYKDDANVWLISGFNILQQYHDDISSYYFTTNVFIWGWATWKRAWKFYDFQMTCRNDKKKRQQYKNFVKDSADINYHLERIAHLPKNMKNVTFWALQWQWACRINGGLTIIPHVNLVENIGIGNVEATHTDRKNNQLGIKSLEMMFPLNHPSFIEVEHTLSKRSFKAYCIAIQSRFFYWLAKWLPFKIYQILKQIRRKSL